MIDGADFLKWCEIFKVQFGGTPTGSVTEVDTGTGLTGGPITTTGTISLANIATQTFLANTTGGSAPPIPTPLNASYISVLFTPVNYTPINSSVEGNLIGIDNALGDVYSQGLQAAYNSGSNALINLSANRPISIQSVNSASSVNAVTTPSTGNNTVGNWRVLGWTFNVISACTLTALQYQDSRFSSGTRTVGIYLKSTGELLNSVDVSKTDPLDASNTYRTQVLFNPVLLSPGVDYVIATVVPAGETSNLNSNAVPGANINITERCTGNSSLFPIPLSFPTSFVVDANNTAAGFFEYSISTLIDSVSFPDSTTNNSSLMVAQSTTRGSIVMPVMTVAQQSGIASPVTGMWTFISDTSPARPQVYASGWNALAYVSDIPAAVTLQSAYDNGDSISIASSRPLTFSNPSSSIEFNNDSKSYISKVTSTTQGVISFPVMTLTQRNAITSPDVGLQIYNSTYNTIDYFDGSAWQIGATLDHLIAGTNITLNQNGDGTMTINSAGSGPGTESDYSAWGFDNNTVVTTFNFVNFDTAVGVDPDVFDDIVSSNFTNVVSGVSTNNAPIFQYDGSATQYFQCNFNIYVRGTVLLPKDYTFEIGIMRASGGGAIEDTGYKGSATLVDNTTFYCISLSGIVQLDNNDRVLVVVKNLTDTTSLLAAYASADIVNVNATDAFGVQWNNVTTTSDSMNGENGYVTSNAALVTLSLPSFCNFGDVIQIDGFGAGGFQITQGSGQQIFYEGASTTLGLTGTLSSTNSKACVTLRCVVANTTFVVENTTGAITLA